MKFHRIVFPSLAIAVLLVPSAASAQRQVARFEATSAPSAEAAAVAFSQPDLSREQGNTLMGVVVGGLAGLALGAGVGLLLYDGEISTQCDDGFCGWELHVATGGLIGAALGAWLGYRVAAR